MFTDSLGQMDKGIQNSMTDMMALLMCEHFVSNLKNENEMNT